MGDRLITYLGPEPKAGDGEAHLFNLELRGRGTWRVRVVFSDSLLTSVEALDYRPRDRVVELGFWRISELLIPPAESPEPIQLNFSGDYRLPKGEVLDKVSRAITRDKEGRLIYEP
jgi:hypothetical protein